MKKTEVARPKIVSLDSYTLNPGDLDWQYLHDLGECMFYDRTSPGQVLERAAGAKIVLTNKTPITREHIVGLEALRYIGVLATGYNIVDVAAAKERGIPVTNVPGYGTTSVAQHVFALLLELTQRVGDHANSVTRGRWSESPDFCFWDYPLGELWGKTLGIVGYGSIGQAVAKIGRAFGMNVLASSRSRRGEGETEFVTMEELFRRADVVSLHCPLTDDNRGFINAALLQTMKPTALLINTARGPLIVEDDLAAALNSGRIAGAGLDVLAAEPPPLHNPLLQAKNCLITPHIAWATKEARQRLLHAATNNLAAWLDGHAVNVVNA